VQYHRNWDFGWDFRVGVMARAGAEYRFKPRLKETDMSANLPILPVAGGTLLRVLAFLLAVVTHWLKALAQARRHRREAKALAGLDRHMLADIGITRADVCDAFSGPFWEDPTALLRERAIERRLRRVTKS
jgi:uncharacterized protein YjiS (DUF1127 family)